MNDRYPTESLSPHRAFRRLLGYTQPYKKTLLFAFVLLLGATTADVVGPILAKIFIDDYLTPRIFHWQPLVILGGTYLFLHIAAVGLNYYQLLLFQKVALWIIQQLRIDVFNKVQHLGLSFFDQTPGGSLVSRITNDTEAIKDLFVHVLSTFVKNGVFLIGILIGMLILDVKLALICLIFMPLIVGLMFTYRHFSSKVYRIARHKLSLLNAKLNESISGMNMIQAMRQEKRLRREFAHINQQHNDALMQNIKLNSLLLRPAVEFLYLLAVIALLSFFGFQSLDNIVEIGVLYAFVNYLERFFEPVNGMMMRLNQFQQAVVSAERVFGLLDDQRLAPVKEGSRESPLIEQGHIEFKNVTFSYDGKTDVLKNISFTARPGETVALVGQTGSGKSSIVNLLMRFYPLERGEITIDGRPLSMYDNTELRQKVGLVLQDSFLFVGNVKGNIRLSDEKMSEEDIQRAAQFVQADPFIQRLPQQYDEPIGERGATLSSGQRQLIAFARTMALNPKILVLDEATASVDTETEEAIQLALHKMRKGRTTIAIAHRLFTIQDADHILVLHKGEIVERGTHRELIAKKGLYHKMYLLQQGTREHSNIG